MAPRRLFLLLAALAAVLACCLASEWQHEHPAGRRQAEPRSWPRHGGTADAAAAAWRRVLQEQAAAAAADGAKRCPALSKELFQRRARNNTVMVAVVRQGGAGVCLQGSHPHVAVQGTTFWGLGASQCQRQGSAPCTPLQMNEAQWDFALNWRHHVQKARGRACVGSAPVSGVRRVLRRPVARGPGATRMLPCASTHNPIPVPSGRRPALWVSLGDTALRKP